jgi:Domain of unknown function (DUF4421)
MFKKRLHLLLNLLLVFYFFSSYAQRQDNHDTSYYVSFPRHFTARLFLSQKYGNLYFRRKDARDIIYQSNLALHLGAGVTIHQISLSGAVSIVNQDKDKGKTSSFDIHLHAFPRGWLIDGVAFFNKGYHLNREDAFPLNSTKYYFRPDIRLSLIEADAFRVVNKNKFSFRAALGQAEWQKKSAGTFLYGGYASYGWMRGDSVLIPAQFANLYLQAGITQIRFFHIGPGIGYAYTAVVDQHFFIMASLIGTANLNFTREVKENDPDNSFTVLPGAIYKASIGYNSRIWSVAADLMGNALLIKGQLKDGGYILPTGVYRLTIARKFLSK